MNTRLPKFRTFRMYWQTLCSPFSSTRNAVQSFSQLLLALHMQITAELRNQEQVLAASETSRSDAAASWLTPGRFAILLGLLVFAGFPAVLLGKATFVFRDFALFSYPVAFFHKESFWRGELPLWNPYNYCGIPFLAQWNTMVLYPFALIYLLLPLTWSLPFFCLAHMWWGGWGMYFLAHRWTGNRLAAGVAGVVFCFNGLMQNFLMWPSHVATFAWLPWVLWLVPEGWRAGGRKLVLAVLVASLQMLAGGPETILFTWLLLLLLAVGEWLTGSTGSAGALAGEVKNPRAAATESRQSAVPPSPAVGERVVERGAAVFSLSLWERAGVRGIGAAKNPGHSTYATVSRISDFFRRGRRPSQSLIPLRFTGIAALVFLVCAAQLLPFLELLVNSSRDARTASAGFEWSMPLWGWANFLVPMFRTVPSSQGVFFQLQQNWTSSYYAGIATVFFAGIAVWRSKDWRVMVLAGSAFVALVLALGDAGFIYRGLRACIPMIGCVRYPVKFAILIVAVMPLLAAVGLHRLIAQPGQKRYLPWGWVLAFLVLVGAIVAFDQAYPMPEDQWHLTWKNGLARSGFVILLLLLTVGVLQSRGHRQILYCALLLVVFWLDLATHVPNQNPTAPPHIYTAGWAKARLDPNSRPQLGHSRLMLAPEADEALRYHALPSTEQDALTKRLAFFCDANLLDRVPQTYGLFSLGPAHIGNLANLPYVHTNLCVSRVLDFMGVSRSTAPGTLNNWVERPTAMPLVTAGQKPVFTDDDTTIAALLQTNVDLRRIVLLPKDAQAGITATSQVSTRVVSCYFETRKVFAQVEAPTPSLVVVAQSYYPAWRAYVDGKAARIWRANYAFQALEVPAGSHSVLLKYQDRTFMAGVVLSCLGLLLCLSFWILGKDRFQECSSRREERKGRHHANELGFSH